MEDVALARNAGGRTIVISQSDDVLNDEVIFRPTAQELKQQKKPAGNKV